MTGTIGSGLILLVLLVLTPVLVVEAANGNSTGGTCIDLKDNDKLISDVCVHNIKMLFHNNKLLNEGIRVTDADVCIPWIGFRDPANTCYKVYCLDLKKSTLLVIHSAFNILTGCFHAFNPLNYLH